LKNPLICRKCLWRTCSTSVFWKRSLFGFYL